MKENPEEQKRDPQAVIRRQGLTPGASLHVRQGAEGEPPSRRIEGYAILFGVPSEPLYADEECETREVIAPEAFTRAVLDASDIRFTLFHNGQLLLARSRNGKGSLSYSVDEKGVSFSFDAPATADGDKALELVRRGDLAGCSFAFTTRYWDRAFVSRSVVMKDTRRVILYTVRAVTGLYDFTLTDNPAYADTSVEARSFAEALKSHRPATERPGFAAQVAEMRRAAAGKTVNQATKNHPSNGN